MSVTERRKLAVNIFNALRDQYGECKRCEILTERDKLRALAIIIGEIGKVDILPPPKRATKLKIENTSVDRSPGPA
jgi:hypothetical protein